MGATKEGAIEDEAAANTGAEGDEEHVLGASPGTEPKFPEGGEVDVVFYDGGEVEMRLNTLSEGEVVPVEAGGMLDDA